MVLKTCFHITSAQNMNISRQICLQYPDVAGRQTKSVEYCVPVYLFQCFNLKCETSSWQTLANAEKPKFSISHN